MIDVDELLKASATDKEARCFTCRWLDTRPEAERDKWLDAISQPKTFTGKQIAAAMLKVPRESGPPSPSAASVQNHRSDHIWGRK